MVAAGRNRTCVSGLERLEGSAFIASGEEDPAPPKACQAFFTEIPDHGMRIKACPRNRHLHDPGPTATRKMCRGSPLGLPLDLVLLNCEEGDRLGLDDLQLTTGACRVVVLGDLLRQGIDDALEGLARCAVVVLGHEGLALVSANAHCGF